MADDVLESIKSAVADRLKSYFFGGFILALAAANWRAVYVTLFVSVREVEGNVCFPNKLDYIRSFGFNWCKQFWLPMLVAFVVPFVVHHVDHVLIELKERGTQWWLRRREKRGDKDLIEGKLYNAEVREGKRLAAEVDTLEANNSTLRAKVAADKAKVAKAEAQIQEREDVERAHEGRLAELNGLLTAYQNFVTSIPGAILYLTKVETSLNELASTHQILENDRFADAKADLATAKATLEAVNAFKRHQPLGTP